MAWPRKGSGDLNKSIETLPYRFRRAAGRTNASAAERAFTADLHGFDETHGKLKEPWHGKRAPMEE